MQVDLIIDWANDFYQDCFGENISQETQDLIGIEICGTEDAYDLNDCEVEEQKLSLGERDAIEYAFDKYERLILQIKETK